MPARSANTILVVEDAPDCRFLLRRLLMRSGYEVSEANDGIEALEYLRKHDEPIGIILDLRMPRMDGVGFRKAQLADPRLASIPVLIYSCEPASRALSGQLHADGYINKTGSHHDLLRAISEIFLHEVSGGPLPLQSQGYL